MIGGKNSYYFAISGMSMPAINMLSESGSNSYSSGAASSASTSAGNQLQKFSILCVINATAEAQCSSSPSKEVAVSSIVNCLKDETGEVEMPKFTACENGHETSEEDENNAIETLLLLSGSNNNYDAGKGRTDLDSETNASLQFRHFNGTETSDKFDSSSFLTAGFDVQSLLAENNVKRLGNHNVRAKGAGVIP